MIVACITRNMQTICESVWYKDYVIRDNVFFNETIWKDHYWK